MIAHPRRLIGAALAAFILFGCGGGGEGQVAGIDRTGAPTTVYGTISTFGSIVVNGVHYDTSRSQFTIDGNGGTQDDLGVGDVVLVRGTRNLSGGTGVAATVSFDDAVEGPIALDSIDPTAGTFIVLGQTVRVGADTSFDVSLAATSLAELVAGTAVEVSGFSQADGSVRATRIKASSGRGLELTGLVGNLNMVARTFTIGAQLVDFSSVLQLEAFPPLGIANGQRVEVKASALVGSALRATRVEYQGGRFDGNSGDRRELEGFVTRFASPSDFDLAGVRVTTTNSTLVQGTLGLNAKVQVEGALSGAGTLAATKIEVRGAAPVRLAALVDSVNASSGTLVVLGVSVNLGPLTRLEDKSSQQVRPLLLSSIAAGNYVDIRGMESPAGSGQVLAEFVERRNPDSLVQFQAFVQAKAQPEFSMLGVRVNTSGARLRDSANTALTPTQFFSALQLGSLVRLQGRAIGDRAVQAEEVELRN